MSLILSPLPTVVIKGRARLTLTILVTGEAYARSRTISTIRAWLMVRVVIITMLLHLRQRPDLKEEVI